MTFEQDTGVHRVDLTNLCVVHVLSKHGEEKVEVGPADRSSMNVVVGGQAKVVAHIWFHLH